MTAAALPVMTGDEVRRHLLQRREIALVDVREEDPYAQAHPLFAVQLSAGRIALDAPWRLPLSRTMATKSTKLQDAAASGSTSSSCRA